MFLHTYIHTNIHTYIQMRSKSQFLYPHGMARIIFVLGHTYIHTHTYIHIHTDAIEITVSLPITYVCFYIRAYIHTYIHTYTYTYRCDRDHSFCTHMGLRESASSLGIHTYIHIHTYTYMQMRSRSQFLYLPGMARISFVLGLSHGGPFVKGAHG